MKAILSLVIFFTASVIFTAPVKADDPCETLLCMYGKVTGHSGGSSCSDPEKAFFNINAFKKHNLFDPSKTADMRKDFLGQCPQASSSDISAIIEKYGEIKG